MTKYNDAAYVVIAEFPPHGPQVWRGGVYDSPEEAKEAFEAFYSWWCVASQQQAKPWIIDVREIRA